MRCRLLLGYKEADKMNTAALRKVENSNVTFIRIAAARRLPLQAPTREIME